jgi:hypothetical protein
MLTITVHRQSTTAAADQGLGHCDLHSWFPAGLRQLGAFSGAFDDLGFPIQQDGSSTVVHGLHFMGVHFQRKRKSATFLGVAEDAAVLAERIVADRG